MTSRQLQSTQRPSSKRLSSTSQRQPKRTRTLAQKLALFSGGGAAAAVMVAAPSSLRADIVESATVPISPPTSSGSAFWDVDGDGTNDFRLYNYVAFLTAALFDDTNGGRLVAQAFAGSDGISKLAPGVTVGPVLGSAYRFHIYPQTINSITRSGDVSYDAGNGGWAYGDTGFFGFKFTSGGDTFYGWGELTIDDRGNDGFGDNYIINRAFYNDTADGSIQVGVVPEPSSIALLALGAAGLLNWRRRRNRDG